MAKVEPNFETSAAAPAFDPAALERGRLLFAAPCTFIAGVVDANGFPHLTQGEVAFAGRSNVGKSSLINALTGQKALARTSRTPGRTQQINFFDLGERLTLADLPGYGYAKASKTEIAKWTELARLYLKGRAVLRRTCLLIDGRHGLKSTDLDLMKILDESAVVYQVILTKVDQVRAGDLEKILQKTADTLRKHPAAHADIRLTSSEKGIGIPELRAELAELGAA
jgi:GTP-binding protein